MTRLLVLGGTSYVAQWLCRRLLDGSLHKERDDIQVACTVRSTEIAALPEGFALALDDPRVVHVIPGVDLLADETVVAAIDAFDPTVVVNCIALASPAACQRDPTTAYALNHPSGLIQHLQSRSANKPVHYVQFSTDFVYDGCAMPAGGYREHDAIASADHCVYSASKLAFDAYLLARPSSSQLRVTVLRIANVVGGPAPFFSDQPPKFAQWLYRELFRSADKATSPVRLWEDEVRSFLYVEDLVRVLWTLIQSSTSSFHETTCVVNVGGVDAMSRVEFAERFASAYERLYPESTSMRRPIGASARAAVDLGYCSPLDARLDCAKLRGLVPGVAFTQTDEMMHELSRLFHG